MLLAVAWGGKVVQGQQLRCRSFKGGSGSSCGQTFVKSNSAAGGAGFVTAAADGASLAAFLLNLYG
jgi:hypothetical protein